MGSIISPELQAMIQVRRLQKEFNVRLDLSASNLLESVLARALRVQMSKDAETATFTNEELESIKSLFKDHPQFLQEYLRALGIISAE